MKPTAVRRLLLEGLGIVALTAAGGVAVYLLTVHPAKNSRPLGAANVNLSRISGPQTEVSLAVDPRNRRILLAGANDDLQPRFRAYSSADGGATWRPSLG